MCSKYNMKIGFALIVAPTEKKPLEDVIAKCGSSWPFRIFPDAGYVAEGPKQVVIEPKGIVLDKLAIR
jgi:hypothetical protein